MKKRVTMEDDDAPAAKSKPEKIRNNATGSEECMLECTFAIFEFMLAVMPSVDSQKRLRAFEQLKSSVVGSERPLKLDMVREFLSSWRTKHGSDGAENLDCATWRMGGMSMIGCTTATPVCNLVASNGDGHFLAEKGPPSRISIGGGHILAEKGPPSPVSIGDGHVLAEKSPPSRVSVGDGHVLAEKSPPSRVSVGDGHVLAEKSPPSRVSVGDGHVLAEKSPPSRVSVGDGHVLAEKGFGAAQSLPGPGPKSRVSGSHPLEPKLEEFDAGQQSINRRTSLMVPNSHSFGTKKRGSVLGNLSGRNFQDATAQLESLMSARRASTVSTASGIDVAVPGRRKSQMVNSCMLGMRTGAPKTDPMTIQSGADVIAGSARNSVASERPKTLGRSNSNLSNRDSVHRQGSILSVPEDEEWNSNFDLEQPSFTKMVSDKFSRARSASISSGVSIISKFSVKDSDGNKMPGRKLSAALQSPMDSLRKSVDLTVLQSNDDLCPKHTKSSICEDKRISFDKRKSMANLKVDNLLNDHIEQAMSGSLDTGQFRDGSRSSLSDGLYIFEWCDSMTWAPLALLLRFTGIVPFATGTRTRVMLSNLYCILVLLVLMTGCVGHASVIVMMHSADDRWGYVMYITELVVTLATLFTWRELRLFFRQPIFLTFLEYAERKEFTALWTTSANIVVAIVAIVTIPVTVTSCMRPSRFDDLEPMLESWLPRLLYACEAVVYVTLFAGVGVLVLSFKFAHIAAYTFAAETMESHELDTVCSRWSIFIILTRSLSTAFARLFVVLTALSFYIVVVIVILMITGLAAPFALVPFVALVLAGLLLVLNAAEIETNSNHAISLVNMIDFTEGRQEIDHDKAACVSYLKASDIGFRVGNEPVSMGLAINAVYIFVTVCLALLSCL